LESIKSETITIYHIGDKWWDLCAGPHVESTGKINPKAVALQSLSGAYWRGDEKNAMLQVNRYEHNFTFKALDVIFFIYAIFDVPILEIYQRLYGTAWENPLQLKSYKKRLEEAKLRDHRVLGQKLDLFSIQDHAGGGLVFWHPKGAIIRRIIEDYWKNEHIAV
jgi:threonyl-tRNA synthetase